MTQIRIKIQKLLFCLIDKSNDTSDGFRRRKKAWREDKSEVK